MKKILIITLSLVVLFTAFFTIENSWVKNRQDYVSFNQASEDEYDYSELSYYNTSDYYNYLNEHGEVYPQVDPIVIEAINYSEITGEFETFDNYEGTDDVLLTDEYGSVTWEVEVAEAGYYNLNLNYYPYTGKSSSIERTLYINGEVPFESANIISFYRIWGNNTDVVQDINGNDIRPSQVELPEWTSSYFNDHIGYINDPYAFYFEAGVNTITLQSVREPLMIKSIELLSVEDYLSYSDVLAEYQSLGYSEVAGTLELVQAEEAISSSSPTLYP